LFVFSRIAQARENS